MATAGRTSFTVVAGPEFTLVARALRDIETRLPGEFRKKLRKSADSAVADTKNHIRSMQVAGHSGHTGLRRTIALGVRVQAGVGKNPYLRIVTAMPEGNEAIIPRGFDRPTGWRHPVFGSRTQWARNIPINPGWFRPVIASHRQDVEDGLNNALQWAADVVASAGHA